MTQEQKKEYNNAYELDHKNSYDGEDVVNDYPMFNHIEMHNAMANHARQLKMLEELNDLKGIIVERIKGWDYSFMNHLLIFVKRQQIEKSNHKERIMSLLRSMSQRSTEYRKHEKELCEILTPYVKKIKTIEEAFGYSSNKYPDKIDDIQRFEEMELYGMPHEIWCCGGSFRFRTEWLNIDFKEEFESTRRIRMADLELSIRRNEEKLKKYKEALTKYSSLKFEDVIKTIEEEQP